MHEEQECRIAAVPLASLTTEAQGIPLRKLTMSRDNKGRVTQALAWDDLTSMRLDAGRVIEARSKEMEYVKETEIRKNIPRREARQKNWKNIETRRIDINKGDDQKPVYRSRLVGI